MPSTANALGIEISSTSRVTTAQFGFTIDYSAVYPASFIAGFTIRNFTSAVSTAGALMQRPAARFTR
jgi:hypothetical protein